MYFKVIFIMLRSKKITVTKCHYLIPQDLPLAELKHRREKQVQLLSRGERNSWLWFYQTLLSQEKTEDKKETGGKIRKKQRMLGTLRHSKSLQWVLRTGMWPKLGQLEAPSVEFNSWVGEQGNWKQSVFIAFSRASWPLCPCCAQMLWSLIPGFQGFFLFLYFPAWYSGLSLILWAPDPFQ